MHPARVRIAVAVLALVAFLAAGWAGIAHEASACGHAGASAQDAGSKDKAPRPDHDPDHCAICRVAGMVPGSAPLPQPLPLPEKLIAPSALAPYEAPRPVVARLSLARGPPASTPV